MNNSCFMFRLRKGKTILSCLFKFHLLSTQKVGNPNAKPHHYSDKPFLLQEEFEVFLPRRYIFITLAAYHDAISENSTDIITSS